ncbi:MAG TPA: hypothetical protein VLS47_02025, partial [Gallionella sp.]|nr:hypothetical protein [Gallionella sp.]
ARLVFFVALSLLLMFVDARYQYLESARSALSVLVSPIQRLASLPAATRHPAGPDKAERRFEPAASERRCAIAAIAGAAIGKPAIAQSERTAVAQ